MLKKIISIPRTIYKKIRDYTLLQLRKPYFKPISKLIPKDASIISTNCFAGKVMQDRGMKYNTPTLGLYFMYPDYIEFLKNLDYYLKEAKLEFVDQSKYPLGNQRKSECDHYYPIGILGGKVEIHFLHYYSNEEAAEKWYRRAKRVNFDKLFIVGMDQNLCSEQDIREFDNLPFKNKIMFSTRNIDLPSNEYMPEFKNSGSVGNAYLKGHLFYKHLVHHFTKRI